MDEPEDEDHAVLGEHVVHHPVVADAEAVEGVGDALDRLHAFARDAAGLAGTLGERSQ